MQIDPAILRFCATKTKEVVAKYQAGLAGADDAFPRVYSDLYWIVADCCGKPIFKGMLNISATQNLVRSTYVRRRERFEILLLRDVHPSLHLYLETKETFHIHLDDEAFRSPDIVDHLQNMIYRASPGSAELNLGHATISETIAEYAALEFLFPYGDRERAKERGNGPELIDELSKRHGIPSFMVDRVLTPGWMTALKPYFGAA